MANPLNIYATAHVASRTVCTAFAEGTGAPIVAPAPLLPGDVFMYGCLRGLKPTLSQAQAERRNWYYADNGYFRPGHFHGYFRITRNRYQHDGIGASSGKRFKSLGLELKPWRTNGSHIVICPPGEVWAGLMGLNPDRWLRETLATLKRHTNRPVRIRQKQATTSLASDLAGAWGLVTFMSNAAVEAILAGIPVVCTADCAARVMGGTLETIENLPMPDRETWAGVLADNQWTLQEMKNGNAWRKLKS